LPESDLWVQSFHALSEEVREHKGTKSYKVISEEARMAEIHGKATIDPWLFFTGKAAGFMVWFAGVYVMVMAGHLRQASGWGYDLAAMVALVAGECWFWPVHLLWGVPCGSACPGRRRGCAPVEYTGGAAIRCIWAFT